MLGTKPATTGFPLSTLPPSSPGHVRQVKFFFQLEVVLTFLSAGSHRGATHHRTRALAFESPQFPLARSLARSLAPGAAAAAPLRAPPSDPDSDAARALVIPLLLPPHRVNFLPSPCPRTRLCARFIEFLYSLLLHLHALSPYLPCSLPPLLLGRWL